MIKFQINIESKNHAHKPTADEVGIIRNRLQTQQMTVISLTRAMQCGRTTQPAVFRAQQFVSQQVFIVDVDNSKLLRTVKENKRICMKSGICPNIIVRTFSATQENQKHHLVFVTDRPITDCERRNRLQKALTERFAGDTACHDVKRMFFGGNLIYFSQHACYLTDADIEKLVGGDAACI